MQRMTTVLHPRWANVKQRDMPAPERMTISDYVSVPAVKLYGTWSVLDMISLDEKAKLFGLVKLLEKQRTR
jgi:hypothetical protein